MRKDGKRSVTHHWRTKMTIGIYLTYSEESGEGSTKQKVYFEEEDPLMRLDVLLDWKKEIDFLYAEAQEIWTTKYKENQK